MAVVVSFADLDLLPAGLGQELNVARYMAIAAPPETAVVEPCGTLGSPPTSITVVREGVGYLPLVHSGAVHIVPRIFIRGDCNGDGAVQISDVIFLADRLFSPEDDYPCREACESNGDSFLDIADVVYIAAYLFSGGPPPPPPFPDCGEDPELELALDCLQPRGCP